MSIAHMVIAFATFPRILETVFCCGLIRYGWFWLLSLHRRNAKGIHLPPGPKQKLIGGNHHQIPQVEPWLTYQSWSKTYGEFDLLDYHDPSFCYRIKSPVLYLRSFYKRTIVLNTAKAAQDLLDSRSSIYSDRIKVLSLPGNLRFSIFQMQLDNPRFKSYRRLLQNGLNQKAAKSYRPIQAQEILVMLENLANSPQDFSAHIRRNAVALILKVAYGYQVNGNDDYLVQLIERTFKLLSQFRFGEVFGVQLEGLVPLLKYLPRWVPGAETRQVGREYIAARHMVDNVPFEFARAQIMTGDHMESFVSKNLVIDDKGSEQENLEDHIKWCSSALYVGGGDTTVSAMKSFFLLMTLHPDVQRRAQADIDHVSPDRLPTLDDYDSLLYIQAIVKEVLRWAPVVPLGLAHSVKEDDVYENYYIPKGTTIEANIWAITHDEETYPNPSVFDPSRHLGDNPQPDPLRFVFGFGRRVCPAAHFAERALFNNFANILAVFNIFKPIDERGVEVQPEISWSGGVIMHLNPFECQIKARSKEKLCLIRSSGAF